MVEARLRASRSRRRRRWAFWAESDSVVRERYSMVFSFVGDAIILVVGRESLEREVEM